MKIKITQNQNNSIVFNDLNPGDFFVFALQNYKFRDEDLFLKIRNPTYDSWEYKAIRVSNGVGSEVDSKRPVIKVDVSIDVNINYSDTEY